MNKYGSALRTYCAPVLYEFTVAPPATVTIPAGVYQQVLQTRLVSDTLNDRNIQGNVNVGRIGLFSNFADGFVFGTVDERPALFLQCYNFTLNTPIAGSTSWSGKTLTGSPGSTYLVDLTPGDWFLWGVDVLQIATVVSNTQATVTQYRKLQDQTPLAVSTLTKLTVSVPVTKRCTVAMAPALNTLYSADQYLPIALTGTNVFFVGGVRFDGNTALMTKSIDTAWAGGTAWLDLLVEIEITPR